MVVATSVAVVAAALSGVVIVGALVGYANGNAKLLTALAAAFVLTGGVTLASDSATDSTVPIALLAIALGAVLPGVAVGTATRALTTRARRDLNRDARGSGHDRGGQA